MNEHDLSNLLHEAAGDATVSSNAPRRVLRRTRLRMAATGVAGLSLVALLAGGTFALTGGGSGPPGPTLMPASPVVTPDPRNDLPFAEQDEIFLAEVEGDDSLWTFTAQARNNELCLNSTTHERTEIDDRVADPSGFGGASGIGDCVPLGVPANRHLGFYMWDSGNNDRLEVLGAVSTDVTRLELEGSNTSDEVLTIIRGPEELGEKRNFFYLWLPMEEVGTLVAYDASGSVLQESELCFEPGALGVSCTVGEQSSASESSRAELGADTSNMACDEMTPGKVRNLFAETLPAQAIQRWIDSLDLDLAPESFEIERLDSDTAQMTLPGPRGTNAVSALLSKKGDHQWGIVDLLYCEKIVDPDSLKLPKGLPKPPDPSVTQQPPPSSPSP